MPDQKLLVPGTSGTKLLLNGSDVGWPSAITATAWLAGSPFFSAGFESELGTTIVDELSMEYADAVSWSPTKSTLVPGGVMTPGPELQLVYDQFRGPGTDFDCFPYDWRGDIRRSAELLLAYLQLNRPPGGRWRLVGHSQGGLVIVAASKRFAEEHGNDPRAFSTLVSRVVLLATPLAGTVKAASALIVGDNLGTGFADRFKQIVRTCPAFYQMLPTWPGCVRIAKNDALTRADFNLLDDRAWVGTPIDLALLQRARATRDYLSSPLSRMAGVAVSILMSRAYPTWNYVRLEGSVLKMPETEDEAGDTLVPEDTTYGTFDSVERKCTNAFAGSRSTLQHFAIANDPTVATAVEQALG